MNKNVNIIEIINLNVKVGGQSILNGLNLKIKTGEVHVIFGQNGSGKSTLLSAIMGLPGYKVSKGKIIFHGKRIEHKKTDYISRLGLGIAFQNPPSIEGVQINEFLKAINSPKTIYEELKTLDLNGFEQREINVGFSGGEIKRWEIFKLQAQNPSLVLLDEPESGVDLEHVIKVGGAINKLLKETSGLIITHSGLILNHIKADKGHILHNGKIIKSDDPRKLFKQIQKYGYDLRR